MNDITSFEIIGMFSEIAASVSRNSHWLTRLDTITGDGDHGEVMASAFMAMEHQLAAIDPSSVTPAQLFDMAAETFLTIDSASARLYASAFRRAGSRLPGRHVITEAEFDRAFEAMASGIIDHGQANAPHKNMVDAWNPALLAYRSARDTGGPLSDSLTAAADAALAGAEPDPKRADPLPFAHPDRVMDPGCASAILIMRSMRYALQE
ncbi:DAK2 domain-containing protein [Martelella radicis]|uniref:Dihydroxyacetone kinase-like protein n=1 Tax=Martelella radicis TaxID=1397476 RepID=A0A7W6KIX5_9HYPH|nr:DAK2 domain-containing protein [Martelella radicis]MBB4121845.1 dihydroxyacetone kinase-like protein [Martelella radicis]